MSHKCLIFIGKINRHAISPCFPQNSIQHGIFETSDNFKNCDDIFVTTLKY